MSNFQSFVYASHYNVFCLTETWLSDFIFDFEILPSDFVIYRKDRPLRGGGVLVAVKSSFPSSLVPSPPDLEVVSVKIGIDHELLICTVYVPPNSSETYLSLLLSYLTDLIFPLLKHYLPSEWRTHLIKPIHKSGDNFPTTQALSPIGMAYSSNQANSQIRGQKLC